MDIRFFLMTEDSAVNVSQMRQYGGRVRDTVGKFDNKNPAKTNAESSAVLR